MSESTRPTVKKNAYSPIPWTEKDDATLREMWAAGRHRDEIGRALGRTAGSVKARARRLKLVRWARSGP